MLQAYKTAVSTVILSTRSSKNMKLHSLQLKLPHFLITTAFFLFRLPSSMGLLTWLKNLLDPQPTIMGNNSSLTNQPSQSYLPTKYNDTPVKYHDGAAKYDEDIAPPAYTSATQGAAAGPSRIPIQGAPVFPSQSITGPPPCFDVDGVSPVFFGCEYFPIYIQIS